MSYWCTVQEVPPHTNAFNGVFHFLFYDNTYSIKVITVGEWANCMFMSVVFLVRKEPVEAKGEQHIVL